LVTRKLFGASASLIPGKSARNAAVRRRHAHRSGRLLKGADAGDSKMLLSMHRAQLIKHQRLVCFEARNAVVETPYHCGDDIHVVAQYTYVGLQPPHLFSEKVQGHRIIGHRERAPSP
jgi:hypothetical protein